MKRALLIFAALLALALTAAAPGAAAVSSQPDQGCVSCHPRFAAPMPPAGQGHALACTRCHLGHGQAKEAEAAHRDMVKNPSSLDQAERACGSCHAGWPAKVKLSPMASNMGLIAQTRYLWGAQDSLEPRYVVRRTGSLAALPQPDQSGQAVDDFLRRRCLRCHLWSPGADSQGARRSAGCAACHRPYDAQGRPPMGHGLSKKVPVSQCLTCHAGCGAGAEFSGRTPRDATVSARFLATRRDQPELSHDRTWRPMRPDVHYQAGLACLDCHPRSEIMGDGKSHWAGLEQVGLRCATCHGELGKKPPSQPQTTHGAPLPHLAWQGGKLLLAGKLDGQPRAVPLIARSEAPVAHRIAGHGKVACHACHAAYNPGAWGMQVLLETRPDYASHAPIAAQGDPQVYRLLSQALEQKGRAANPPQTLDYLSGQMRPGVWLLSPWFRRYQWRVYGLGPEGCTYLLSPRFQYVLTLMDPNGRLNTSAQIPSPGLGVTPWNPHTTARATVGCADCHGSARALGLGLTFARQAAKAGQAPPPPAPELWLPGAEGLALSSGWTRVVDLAGRPMQTFLLKGARPYNQAELRELLYPGKNYQGWLLKALEEDWAFSDTAPSR